MHSTFETSSQYPALHSQHLVHFVCQNRSLSLGRKKIHIKGTYKGTHNVSRNQPIKKFISTFHPRRRNNTILVILWQSKGHYKLQQSVHLTMWTDQNGEGSGVDLEGGCWVCTPPPPPPLEGFWQLVFCNMQMKDKVFSAVHIMLWPSPKPSLYSLLKFVYIKVTF